MRIQNRVQRHVVYLYFMHLTNFPRKDADRTPKLYADNVGLDFETRKIWQVTTRSLVHVRRLMRHQ